MADEKKICCAIGYRDHWPHKCTKTAKFEYEGKPYCATHHPVKRQERQKLRGAVRQEQWDAEHEERRLKAEAQKKLELDAKRYRWLRSADWTNDDKLNDAIWSGMDAMDKAIDAAMKESP